MNTGIFDLRRARQAAASLAAVLSLAACSGGGDSFSFAALGGESQASGAQTGPIVPKTTKTTLARGTVTLKAPKGYCIDETSVSNGLTGGYALLSNCSSLDGKGAGANAATMTVSVSPRREANAPVPTAQDLAVALAPANVLSLQQKGNLALVQVSAEAGNPLKPADPVHWRGATALDTRLVLLAVYAPKGSDLVGSKGADLLVNLARGVSTTRTSLLSLVAPQATGAAKDSADATSEADSPEADTNPAQSSAKDAPEDKKSLLGSIGRLFNRS